MIRPQAILSLQDCYREFIKFARAFNDAERWTVVAPRMVTHTPASTSRITCANTYWATAGKPIKWTQSGETYYGIIVAVSANSYVDIAGPPLITTVDIEMLWVGRGELVHQFRMFVPGAYGASIANTILYGVADHAEYWMGPPARFVQAFYYHKSDDTGTEPTINVTIDDNSGANRVFSGALSVSASFAKSGITVVPANSRIVYGQYVDIDVIAAGGSGDAADLVVTAAFVLE